MRIQHNIMSMNAYRNYNTNTSALSKNLEKLSSGYKINRAGDDAAGLAISEKMRAQITGLNAAQKNVKDGISLVKTAEGAMQEIHDMLNRMDYLATQSANGTYDNEVDRANLQKEVEALRTEINRIADSANFNGIKLLDGSQTAKEAGSRAIDVDGSSRMLQNVKGENEKPYSVEGKKTVLDAGKAVTQAVRTKFKLNLTGLSANLSATSADGTATTGKMTFNIKIGDLTVKNVTVTANGAVSANDIATAVRAAISTMAGSNNFVTINDVAYTFGTASNGEIEFTMKADPYDKDQVAANFSVAIDNVQLKNTDNNEVSHGGLYGSNTVGMYVTQEGKVVGGADRANTVFKITADDIVDGATIKLGDTTITLAVGAKSTNISASAATQGNGAIVDLTDMEEGKIDLNIALSKINGAFAGSVSDSQIKKADGTTPTTTPTFAVGVSRDENGVAVGLTVQRNDAGTDALYTTKDQLASIFHLTYTTEDKATSPLSLQIGDTSDSFNQMTVSIGDMHTSAMQTDAGTSITEIDISTQASAQAAVDVIKNAINYVSGVRGDLGAVQNRLEHTANNLSVMAENIQDAESTIRDTDVAEEMMAYTKNNILIQSAQAMLAQANAVPQGVLQLLG